MAGEGEIVSLVVGGKALQGWQKVSISRSARAAVIEFNLEAPRTNSTNSASASRLTCS